MSNKPLVASLFSGCGGMDLGFVQAGFQVVWANDFEAMACETYARNIGSHIVCGDIAEVSPYSIPDVDIMIGGFPCQDFSMIWQRGGIETDRGNLYRFFVEAVKTKMPKVFVAENVKGLLTANKGAAIEQIARDFAEIGYVVDVDLYNFAEFGVPQLRERIFIVGVRADIDWEFTKPVATHNPKTYMTSGQALRGVKKVPANNEHQNIADKTKKMLELIPEGGNFSDIPREHPLYVKGMISHVYRRLHRNKPATTIIAGGGGGTWGYPSLIASAPAYLGIPMISCLQGRCPKLESRSGTQSRHRPQGYLPRHFYPLSRQKSLLVSDPSFTRSSQSRSRTEELLSRWKTVRSSRRRVSNFKF
jgi:DNA (cytosine-5)-methyltransferase 1